MGPRFPPLQLNPAGAGQDQHEKDLGLRFLSYKLLFRKEIKVIDHWVTASKGTGVLWRNPFGSVWKTDHVGNDGDNTC